MTLEALQAALGADTALQDIRRRAVQRFLQAAYPNVAPATWNRAVATLRSSFSYCQRRGWLSTDPTQGIERRREPQDHTRAIPYAELEALWSRADVPLREKTLWRLLYERPGRRRS